MKLTYRVEAFSAQFNQQEIPALCERIHLAIQDTFQRYRQGKSTYSLFMAEWFGLGMVKFTPRDCGAYWAYSPGDSYPRRVVDEQPQPINGLVVAGVWHSTERFEIQEVYPGNLPVYPEPLFIVISRDSDLVDRGITYWQQYAYYAPSGAVRCRRSDLLEKALHERTPGALRDQIALSRRALATE